MTQQLDMMPGAIADAIEDAAALDRIAKKLPKAREVEPRLPLDHVLDGNSRFDVGHELVLPERAQEDHQ